MTMLVGLLIVGSLILGYILGPNKVYEENSITNSISEQLLTDAATILRYLGYNKKEADYIIRMEIENNPHHNDAQTLAKRAVQNGTRV